MKRKRLDRDTWGFFRFPYYQTELNGADFKGLACLIELAGEGDTYWNFEKAGPTAVTGKGMVWLQLAPAGTERLITVMFVPAPGNPAPGGSAPDDPMGGDCAEHPPFRVSAWYVDVIERIEYDEDGVAAYVDKYLDVIATPAGDLFVDDRDELDDALAAGDVTREQYDGALLEADRILAEWFSDVEETECRSLGLLKEALDAIKAGSCALSRNTENSFLFF
ncbi:MAG: DUF402 domain-containing protein [Clostridia bacterium]|nr:DUF402 domain-containing protein [Clostridia bacterium]